MLDGKIRSWKNEQSFFYDFPTFEIERSYGYMEHTLFSVDNHFVKGVGCSNLMYMEMNDCKFLKM